MAVGTAPLGLTELAAIAWWVNPRTRIREAGKTLDAGHIPATVEEEDDDAVMVFEDEGAI